jgi:cytochrome P450
MSPRTVADTTSRTGPVGYTSALPFGATTWKPALRSGRGFRRDPLLYLQGLSRTDDVFRFQVGMTEFVLVNRPDLIQRVLVGEQEKFGEGKWTQSGTHSLGDCLITREGDSHRERRALLQPSFAERLLADKSDRMVEHALRHAADWTDGAVVDMRQEMNRLALTIAADVLFDLDVRSEAQALCRALGSLLFAIPRLPLPRPRVIAAKRYLRGMAARVNSGHMFERLKAAGLDAREIQNEIIAMWVASADTTPSSLAWIWFSLSREPAVEAALHKELAEVLGGRRPTAADLSRLHWVDRIGFEVLRLYPTVHFIDRRALCDIELGGVSVRAGEYILLCPLLTQRDPRHYTDPERFDPDRFLPGPARKQALLPYFPFGGGPHVCIGMGFARRELALVVATLAQQWQMRPVGMDERPSPQTSSFPMRAEARR